MVEAPRIRIIYDKIKFTKGMLIVAASGASYKKAGVDLIGYTIKDWWHAGKYIYAYLVKKDSRPFVIRTHTMMYGKIIVNDEQVIINPRLREFLVLQFNDGTTLKWYLTQIKFLDPECSTDVLKSNYTVCSSKKAIDHSFEMMKYDISHKEYNQKLLINYVKENFPRIENDMLTDLLLDQEFFPGVGNILQQEALYRCRFLPTRLVKEIGMIGIKCLVGELKNVIDLLYESYLNKLHSQPHHIIFQIYHKAFCPLGHKTITKYLGYHNRRTTWCPVCQS